MGAFLFGYFDVERSGRGNDLETASLDDVSQHPLDRLALGLRQMVEELRVVLIGERREPRREIPARVTQRQELSAGVRLIAAGSRNISYMTFNSYFWVRYDN
jgi:hypothetical protein